MMFVVVRENEKKKIDRRERSGRVQPLLLLSCDGGGLLFFIFSPGSPVGRASLGQEGFFCVSQPAESVEARPSSKTGSKRDTLFFSWLSLLRCSSSSSLFLFVCGVVLSSSDCPVKNKRGEEKNPFYTVFFSGWQRIISNPTNKLSYVLGRL
jgi:hypothetical protein